MSDRILHALETLKVEFKGYQDFLTRRDMAVLAVCLGHLYEIHDKVDKAGSCPHCGGFLQYEGEFLVCRDCREVIDKEEIKNDG